MYKEALKVQIPILGETHRDVKTTKRALDHAYRQQGKFWMITPDEAVEDTAGDGAAADASTSKRKAEEEEEGPGRKGTSSALRKGGRKKRKKRKTPTQRKAAAYAPLEREKYLERNAHAKQARIQWELGAQLRERRMEERMANRKAWGATMVQCLWRCYTAEQELLRRRKVLYATRIQARLRGASVRRRLRRAREAREAEALRLRELAAATTIQQAQRVHAARRELQRRRRTKEFALENKAASVLQRRARIRLAKGGLEARKKALVTLQCACRRRLLAKSIEARQELKAATLLNGLCRRRLAKLELFRRKDHREEAAKMLQRVARRRRARKTLLGKKEERGAMKLQRAFRRKKRRKKPRVWRAIGSALLESWKTDAEFTVTEPSKIYPLTPEGEFDYSSDPMARLKKAHVAYERAMSYMEEEDPSMCVLRCPRAVVTSRARRTFLHPPLTNSPNARTHALLAHSPRRHT